MTPRAAGSLGLRLLAGDLPDSIVLLVSTVGLRQVVEEAVPSVADVGQTVRMPEGLIAAGPVAIDARTQRVSLGWTEMLGGRPTHFVAAPIDGRNLHLVIVTRDPEPPATDAVARWAAMVDRQIGHGRPTARGVDASRRLSALIDNLPLPLAFVDGRSTETFLNDQARTLLDIRDRTQAGYDVRLSLAQLVTDDATGQTRTLADDPRARLTFVIEHIGRHWEVESRWIEEEQLVGRLWLFRDITEEHRVAQFRDGLVSTVSHELRTPLTSILGALTLLREGGGPALSPRADGLVDIAWRNGQRLLRLVSDLLDLDKLGASKLDLDRRATDLAELLTEAIAQSRPLAERHGVRLTADIDRDDVTVSVDAGRMLQVIGNLLSNAIKFSPEGGEVRAALTHRETFLRIAVSDDGPGIAAEFRHRLFTRFAHGPSAPRTGQVGTGLGLAIAKAIVEEHGGAIALDQARTDGATFNVDLPADWA